MMIVRLSGHPLVQDSLKHADTRAKTTGNNINVYSGLLQEELDMLWKTPAKTWDASKGEYFYMRATLITTVHDYLGYRYVAD